MAIVWRAGGVFTTIINDPIGFLGNLVTALRGGFERFYANIWTHLKEGLIQWLLGALSGAGLTLPDKWDLKGFVSIIVQVLGLSYDKSVRPRLVKLIGERAVGFIEGVFDFLQTLVTGGLSAAWEKILEYAENLQEMVIGAIRDWVVKSVVGAAITKLITMFNPVGAIIQGIITIYNTIVFFIERAQQIGALVEAVFDSIANIAAGNLGAAITYVERTMARALPVIIGFLARLIGLGNISGQIRSFIERVQAMVDKAIGKVVDFIVKRVRGLVAGPDTRSPEQKEQDLEKGVNEADQLLQDEKTTPEQVKAALPKIRSRYRLTSLDIVTDSKTEDREVVHVEGEINPRKAAPQTTWISTSGKVRREGNSYVLQRGSIQGAHKIVGEPESIPPREADAAREAAAAEEAAKKADISKVFLGEQATALINRGGKGTAIDAVAVTQRGEYVLYEAKGRGNVLDGLNQLKESSDKLGPEKVIGYYLVVPNDIDPGLSKLRIQGYFLYWGEPPSRWEIHGWPVHVIRTED
jgi:hypothetical protein